MPFSFSVFFPNICHGSSCIPGNRSFQCALVSCSHSVVHPQAVLVLSLKATHEFALPVWKTQDLFHLKLAADGICPVLGLGCGRQKEYDISGRSTKVTPDCRSEAAASVAQGQFLCGKWHPRILVSQKTEAYCMMKCHQGNGRTTEANPCH